MHTTRPVVLDTQNQNTSNYEILRDEGGSRGPEKIMTWFDKNLN